jgi:hypothetical protein
MGPRLRRSAYLLTGDHHLAEDLTQTALARTFAHWRRVRRNDARPGPDDAHRRREASLRLGDGTDEVLTPGSDMEVFLDEDYSTGSPGTLAIAGLPGTDVARVEFVTTAGQVVEGAVHSGRVDGASMMSARVPGELAKVVACDADGEVIEDHPLAPCDDPVECEVR